MMKPNVFPATFSVFNSGLLVPPAAFGADGS
jgi:hypothetical protein